jgi:hypothetical protein
MIAKREFVMEEVLRFSFRVRIVVRVRVGVRVRDKKNH